MTAQPAGVAGTAADAITLGTIEQALQALRDGRPVLVADSPDRENEADVVLAAGSATPEWIAWTIRHSSGYLCAPMTSQRADALELPLMVPHSQDPRRTAYTVTVDAARGVTTGISASDRARTLRVLANPGSGPEDLIRPGHVLPLRAVMRGIFTNPPPPALRGLPSLGRLADQNAGRADLPVGLRSLAPGDRDFKSRYFGDLRSRDAAYHQDRDVAACGMPVR